jgi:hypothetical protein
MSTPEISLKRYSLTIYKLFGVILSLDEKRQQALLEHAQELFAMEKRTAIRKSCNIPVYYATYDRVYSNHIKNISRNGLFIETQRPLFVGEEIMMTFRLKGFEKPIKLKGEIAHASRSGIGVEFKDASPFLAEIVGILVDRMQE